MKYMPVLDDRDAGRGSTTFGRSQKRRFVHSNDHVHAGREAHVVPCGLGA
jgi:hypothetical protein